MSLDRLDHSNQSQDKTKLWLMPTEFGNIELFRAQFYKQNFARHTHDSFPLGIIEQGALSFYYRRNNLVAPAGTINLSFPGEIHDGHSASEIGWQYRMFYFDVSVLKFAYNELINRNGELPFFPNGIIEDRYLANQILSLHYAIEEQQLTKLESEEFILYLLINLILKYSDQKCQLRLLGQEIVPIQKAKEFIHAYAHEEISLTQIARIANLSPFHFSRVFQKESGLTPHAYLTQTRVQKARHLLPSNKPLVDIALESGFFDQSHLTRRFKQIYGITPHQYRKIIQE